MFAGETRRPVRWPAELCGPDAASGTPSEGHWERRGVSVSLPKGSGSGRGGGYGPPRRRTLEANPQARGTVHPNTGSMPAGGGPLMAGHGCQSVSGGGGGGPASHREEKSDKVLRTGGDKGESGSCVAHGGLPPLGMEA